MTGLPKQTILLVENRTEEFSWIHGMLNGDDQRSFAIIHVRCMADAEEYLASKSVDAVLLDLDLPDVRGPESARRIHLAAPQAALVILSELGNERLELGAIEDGAQDYLIQGQIEPRELTRALHNAIARKLIEEALYEEQERAQVTLDCIGDAVISTDPAGNISFLNAAAERLTGWPAQEAIGQPLAHAFRIMDAEHRSTLLNPMEQSQWPERIGALPKNCILIQRNGDEIFIEDSVALIHNRQKRITGSVMVFRDVTASRLLTQKIAHQAEHDFLTGLPNRLLLNDRIEQAIASARRHRRPLAVLFMDIDGFKYVNDSLGHLTGDKLLQAVAKRMLSCVRAPDTVSRQGGDEFVVLLQEILHKDDAAITATRILRVLAEAHTVDRHELHVMASIGVSFYPEDGGDAETLIKNANTAMYQAKEAGHNSFKFFTPAMNVRAVDRQSTEEDLRQALAQREFVLYYQPKVDLRTAKITGVEALLRWKHPTRGLISPMQFIPVAEDSGLILPIGAWVLREACRQAQIWVEEGLPETTMGVNVSSVQFRNEDFLEDLFAALRESGLKPSSLQIELTESALMENPHVAAATLQTLREAGVQVAVDDFGTGYSSLSYLQKFPLDVLKIDQSFIRRVTADTDQMTIVSAIIGMGKKLNLRVIAEGVEATETIAFLKDQQCDEAQGFYFSQPVPAEQFAKLIAA
jgi:diguanylate cyclase (GGDEF)-like protein/PAS domain S-box-containing protein